MEMLVESEFVSWINISQEPLDILSKARIVGWNFDKNFESIGEITLKTITVELKPNSFCELHHSESFVCAFIPTSDDMVNVVSSIFNKKVWKIIYPSHFSVFSKRYCGQFFINFRKT